MFQRGGIFPNTLPLFSCAFMIKKNPPGTTCHLMPSEHGVPKISTPLSSDPGERFFWEHSAPWVALLIASFVAIPCSLGITQPIVCFLITQAKKVGSNENYIVSSFRVTWRPNKQFALRVLWIG